MHLHTFYAFIFKLYPKILGDKDSLDATWLVTTKDHCLRLRISIHTMPKDNDTLWGVMPSPYMSVWEQQDVWLGPLVGYYRRKRANAMCVFYFLHAGGSDSHGVPSSDDMGQNLQQELILEELWTSNGLYCQRKEEKTINSKELKFEFGKGNISLHFKKTLFIGKGNI